MFNLIFLFSHMISPLNSILTEEHRQVISGLSYFLEHLLIDSLDVIGQLHVLRIGQPIENFLLVVDIPIVINVLALAEVRDTGRVPVAIFLRHQSILHPHDLYTVLSSFIVDQLDVPKYSRTLWILLLVYGTESLFFFSFRFEAKVISTP